MAQMQWWWGSCRCDPCGRGGFTLQKPLALSRVTGSSRTWSAMRYSCGWRVNIIYWWASITSFKKTYEKSLSRQLCPYWPFVPPCLHISSIRKSCRHHWFSNPCSDVVFQILHERANDTSNFIINNTLIYIVFLQLHPLLIANYAIPWRCVIVFAYFYSQQVWRGANMPNSTLNTKRDTWVYVCRAYNKPIRREM